MYGIARPLMDSPMNSMGRPKPAYGKALIAGLIGGLVGTAVKTVCESVSPPRPPGAESPLGAGIRIISTHFSGHDLDEPSKHFAERCVHWGFGTVTGGVYGVIAEGFPRATIGYGLGFAVAFWAGAHEIVLPLIGWSPSPLQMTAWEQSNEFVSHLFYGVAAEMVRRSIRPRL